MIGINEPCGVPTPTVKIRTPASAAALAVFTASPLNSSPSVKMMSARFPIALLPKLCVASVMALEMLVPPFGNRFRVEIIDRLDYRVVVNGKRRLQESPAGKRNQTNAVALQFIDQILDGQFDAFEPVWLDVIGQHATRCVHGDEQIESFTLYVLKSVTPSWLRETDDRQRKPKQLQTKSYDAPRPIDRSRELRQKTRGNELLQPCEPRCSARTKSAIKSGMSNNPQSHSGAPKVMYSLKR